MNMHGYINVSNNTIIIDNETYLLTSDYGYKDSSGYIYLVQRAKDSMQSVLNLFAIESSLSQNENYKNLYVSQIEDTDQVCVYLIIDKFIPKYELEKHVVDILAKHNARLGKLNVVDEIPYTLTGKIKLLNVG